MILVKETKCALAALRKKKKSKSKRQSKTSKNASNKKRKGMDLKMIDGLLICFEVEVTVVPFVLHPLHGFHALLLQASLLQIQKALMLQVPDLDYVCLC